MSIATGIIQSAPEWIPALLGRAAKLCDSPGARAVPTITGLVVEALRKKRWPHPITSAIHIGVDQLTHAGVEVTVTKALRRFGGWLAKRWLAVAFASQPIIVLAICVSISVTLAMIA